MIKDIRENQPHIVVALPGSVHVLAVADVRALANGDSYQGDTAQMIQVLARITLDNLNA